MKRKQALNPSISYSKYRTEWVYTLVSSCALAFALVIAAPARGASWVADGKSCLEQTSVQRFLQKAEDPKQPYEERRKAYENAVRFCPQEQSIYTALAALLLGHQDAETALIWARKGLQIAPRDPDLTVYEGIALLLAGDADQAVSVLKTTPAKAKNEFYLGMAYRALREHKEAQQALSKAFALGFNDPYLLYVLIEQDRALGDKEAGLRDFQVFYERFLDSPWLHMLYGDAYMSKHDDANAETEYQQVAKLAPNLPIVEYQLGYIDFERSNYAAAEGHFRKEIATDPSLAASYLYLGTTLRRLGRNLEALPFLEQAVKRDPNYILAYNELATAQVEAGRLGDALHTLQKGEDRFPQETAFPAQLAGLFSRLGRTEEAKNEAEKAARLRERNQPPPPGVSSGPSPPFSPQNENP